MGGGLIVKVIASTANAQGGFPVADNEMVTAPVSPEPGIYVGVKPEVLVKYPLPSSLHEWDKLLEAEAPEIV